MDITPDKKPGALSGCCCGERKRGRPVQIDPDLRARLIVDAAENVLAEEGVARITMAAVAREAGMSKRTVYAHFATREELICACIERMHEAIVRPLSAAAQDLPLAQRLDLLLTLNLEATAAGRKVELLRSVIAEAPSQPELAASVLRSGLLALAAQIKTELDRAVDRGEAEIPDTELAAEMLRDMAYPNVLEVLLRCDVPHEERVAKLEKRRPLAVAAFCKAVAPDRG
ncbi:TetR/AcrR family transcriptional regulator [Pseudooceanicola nanhaiensis]|uniref:TetR/AcrR family transcriptional regulator n=1 Tax=Pseudooceanicola nanhaiensis TaxID=375761 RepID=UPI001CD6B96D|nr:TetR/AcrR family transcriptional regulator [Pseudooceanicola nanhaiensis]MCA0919963.1 TetR/AcrR family transcriptional regulator [Pseudooceanicola nanhaiensis]